ncbi:RNase H domain-containing protein [Trichonephila clavipes]|uniref:RNase H domain-containing protein n=1 Tax=Trichonephila clavipes TaxID=2585209 RepID=A0A8X6WG40_TRICX|nr:RNase H domain-containing protein [Trichonephila clavipes]
MPILEYGIPVYCSASVTNLQKLEKVQLSAAWIITGLKNTCPRDIVLFEAELQPLSLRRRACLTKYYNKLRSLDSRNCTSAYFNDWGNNQRLRRNSPFSQMVSFNLTIGAVITCHNVLIQRMILTGSSFIQNYQHTHRSGSGIYIKPQDHILRIQRRNPDGCSVFRSELIAIDEALGSLASLPNGKEKKEGRSAIQHLSNWQSVRDNVGVSILTKLKGLSNSHQIHLQWIPSQIDLDGNTTADTLAKAGACELPQPSAPLTFLEIFSRTKHQNKTACITPPEHHWYQCSHPGGSLAHSFTRQDQALLARFRSGHIKSMKFSEGRKSFEMCTNCSSEPATPVRILECLGFTKQDLTDVPLLVLDFLKVYDVMDLF